MKLAVKRKSDIAIADPKKAEIKFVIYSSVIVMRCQPSLAAAPIKATIPLGSYI